MIGYIVAAWPWNFVRLVLASVCEVCFFTDVFELFPLFGPRHRDCVMIRGGTSPFLFLFADIIEVGLLFCSFALEGVLAGPWGLFVCCI